MSRLTSEKLTQAENLVRKSGVDAWITFVRETAGGGDPILPFIVEGGLTWQSALIITSEGERIAVLGNYDADALRASGDWTEVIPYVEGIREPLLAALHSFVKSPHPKLAVNYSPNDVKGDGLSHGMFLLLQEYLKGTKFEGSLVTSEEIVLPLRGQKSGQEIEAIKNAVIETEGVIKEIGRFAKIGKSEQDVYQFAHEIIRERNFGFAWDPAGDPIINSGPNSMIGHGIPSASIFIEPGHVFHIDIGITMNNYSSDLQRCWYVKRFPNEEVPERIIGAARAVNQAITVSSEMLKPGVLGWEVDAAARAVITGHGYPEYLHALGHQVGRVAHDGGAILGPRWERYGRTPEIPVRVNEVYTLELGVIVENGGYLGLEEMVVVRPHGVEWLSSRQTEMWTIN